MWIYTHLFLVCTASYWTVCNPFAFHSVRKPSAEPHNLRGATVSPHVNPSWLFASTLEKNHPDQSKDTIAIKRKVRRNTNQVIILPDYTGDRNKIVKEGSTADGQSPKGFGEVDKRIIFPTTKPSPVAVHIPSITTAAPLFVETNCDISGGLINFRGSCQPILTQSFCPDGYWLVANAKLGFPECAKRPCPGKQLFYKGRCVDVEKEEVCGVNEMLYVDFTGTTHCDCEPLYYIFDPVAKQCRGEHGPLSCAADQYLKKLAEDRVTCVPNPCPNEDMIPDQGNNQCVRKDFKGPCPITHEYSIVVSNKTAICALPTDIRNIFEVSIADSCPSGSRKDYFNKCQKIENIEPRSPFAFRSATKYVRYGECLIGYTLFPDGSCKKVAPLFGSGDV